MFFFTCLQGASTHIWLPLIEATKFGSVHVRIACKYTRAGWTAGIT